MMKERIRLFVLGGVLIVLAVLLQALLQEKQDTRQMPDAAAAEAETVVYTFSDTDTGMPGILLPVQYDNGLSVAVPVWPDAAGDDSAFYLFLPAGAETDSAVWDLRGAERLYIDGEAVQTGDHAALSDDIHTIDMTVEQTSYQGKLHIKRSSGLDAVFIRTTEGDTAWLHEDKEHASPGHIMILSPDGAVSYAGVAERVRCRGNASFDDVPVNGKKSYAVKLEKKADLLDTGAAKKYVLVSNIFDRSLTRNRAADILARETDVPYAVEEKYVDLYFNDEYAGNYLLYEQIEIKENRIAIRDLEQETERANAGALEDYVPFSSVEGRLAALKGFLIPENPQDISGGYLIEMELLDRYGAEKSAFITEALQAYIIHAPEAASQEQVLYIGGLVQELEEALNDVDGVNPYTGKHYTEYLDADSFARHYIIEELTKNLDAASTSQYFYKPEDAVSTKLFAGPVWDHDKAFGLYDGQGEGLSYEGYPMGDPEGLFAAGERSVYNLWHALYRHGEFRDLVADIYRSLTYGAAVTLADETIPELAEQLAASADMNAIRWGFSASYSLKEEAEKVASFLRQRADWLLEEWGE